MSTVVRTRQIRNITAQFSFSQRLHWLLTEWRIKLKLITLTHRVLLTVIPGRPLAASQTHKVHAVFVHSAALCSTAQTINELSASLHLQSGIPISSLQTITITFHTQTSSKDTLLTISLSSPSIRSSTRMSIHTLHIYLLTSLL